MLMYPNPKSKLKQRFLMLVEMLILVVASVEASVVASDSVEESM